MVQEPSDARRWSGSFEFHFNHCRRLGPQVLDCLMSNRHVIVARPKDTPGPRPSRLIYLPSVSRN